MSRSTERSPVHSGLWLLILTLATFALYYAGLHIWYYGDDFQYLYDSPGDRILYFFHHRNLYHGFYRPVNSAIIAIVQLFCGWETWPIHVVNIIVHALLAWMVYRFMVRERFTPWQAILGSAFMVISQQNAGAVLSNDTFSQISGTFFGCLTLYILYIAFFRGNGAELPRVASDRFPLGRYLLGLFVFAISLASKETSVAYLPIVCVFFLVKNWRERPVWKDRLFRTAIETFPYFVLTIAYVAVRSAIGLSQPTGNSGTYGFQFGLNIIRNLAQFFFAAIVPASSATTFVALKTRDLLLFGAIAAGSLLFLGVVGYGVWKSQRPRSIPVMLIFTFLGLIPAIFMNHVGELYLYNSMPFISVVVGAGLGTLLERSRRSTVTFAVFLLFLILLATSHIIAIQSKATVMIGNGARARKYLGELGPYMARVPQGGQLFLLNPPNGPVEYSVFLMNELSSFKWGEHVIAQEHNRPDVNVRVIEQADMTNPSYLERSLILTVKDDSLVVVKEPGNSQ